MKLDAQKRVAAKVLKCGPGRVRFNPAHLHDIKDAITKSDMRLLVSDGLVAAIPKKGISRSRARKIRVQKRKGLRRGSGSRKGTMKAAIGSKEQWMLRVRSQRAFLAELKEKGLLSLADYHMLYRKSKGGFFRSVRHIKLFIDDKRLWQAKPKKEESAAAAAAANE